MGVEHLLVAGIGGLSAAVVALWRVGEKRYDDCDKDRRELWKAVSSLKNATCLVSGCRDRVRVNDEFSPVKVANQ
jgi:hypothetical protein